MHARKFRSLSIAAAVAFATAAPALAAEDIAAGYRFNNRNVEEDVLGTLANLPHTLMDAIRAVEDEGETVTLAKFETSRDGEVFLTLMTSAQGLGVDADQTAYKQYRAKINRNTAWRPQGTEVRDPELIARGAEYHTLLSMSQMSLREVAREAEDEGDKVVWVQPRVVDGRAIFDVGVIRNDQLRTVSYDLLRGNKVDARRDFDFGR